MKKTIQFLALALALCLSLCACGGKAEETTEPVSNEDRLVELIFAEEMMQGLEHYGLSINADQASTEQMLMATTMLNLHDHTTVEGWDHLYNAAAYAYMPLTDGNWHVPVYFILPSDETGENIRIGNPAYVYADFGRVHYSTELITLALTEEEVTNYAQTDGWEEFSNEQIYVFALLQECLAELGLNVESENVFIQMEDRTVFTYAIRSGEEGDVMTIINLLLYQPCQNGNSVIAYTMVDNIPIRMEDGQYYFEMSEDEKDAFNDFMNYTGFYNWFEIAE